MTASTAPIGSGCPTSKSRRGRSSTASKSNVKAASSSSRHLRTGVAPTCTKTTSACSRIRCRTCPATRSARSGARAHPCRLRRQRVRTRTTPTWLRSRPSCTAFIRRASGAMEPSSCGGPATTRTNIWRRRSARPGRAACMCSRRTSPASKPTAPTAAGSCTSSAASRDPRLERIRAAIPKYTTDKAFEAWRERRKPDGLYLVTLDAVRAEHVDYFDEPWIPLRVNTIVCGVDGIGKSTILYDKAGRRDPRRTRRHVPRHPGPGHDCFRRRPRTRRSSNRAWLLRVPTCRWSTSSNIDGTASTPTSHCRTMSTTSPASWSTGASGC